MIQTLQINENAKLVNQVLEQDGAVIIENFLDFSELQQLDLESTRVLNSIKNCNGYFYGFSTKRASCMVAKSEVCKNASVHPLLLEVMDHFLLPNCSDYQLNLSQLICIGSGEKKQIIHADDPMFPFEHKNDMHVMLNVMIAIDDFTVENGATMVVPGSHLWKRDRHPTEAEIQQAVMKKGSVLIWLGSTRHGGGANSTLQSRRGVVLSYNLGWLKQADNYFLSIPREEVKTYPVRLQKLLGYFVHKPNLNMVEGRDPIELLSNEGLGQEFKEYMPEGVSEILAEHYHSQKGSVSEVKFS